MVYVNEISHLLFPPDHRLTIIDSDTETILESLELTDQPFAVSASREGKDVFVSNYATAEVLKFEDLYRIPNVSQGALTVFPGVVGASGSVVSQDNNFCYVASASATANLKRIDTRNDTMVTLPLQSDSWVFGSARAVAIHHDGKSLFASPSSLSSDCGFIPHIINPDSTEYRIEPIEIDSCGTGWAVTVSPNGRHLFIGTSSFGDYGLVRIPIKDIRRYEDASVAHAGLENFDKKVANLRSRAMVKIHLQGEPFHLALTPDNKWLFATMRSGRLAIVDPETDTVVKNLYIDGSENLRGITITPDGKRAYIGTWGGVVIVDVTSQNVIKRLSTARDNNWAFWVAMGPKLLEEILLRTGLNLFAYPSAVPFEHSTCSGLAEALGGFGVIESIARLDTTTGLFERCDTSGGVDFPIISGEAYIVEASSDVFVEWPWSAVCPSLALDAGVNLIGHPSTPPDLTCFNWLEAQAPGLVTTIQRLNNVTGRFEYCVLADLDGTGEQPAGVDFPIRASEGYLFHVKDSGTLVLPGCP